TPTGVNHGAKEKETRPVGLVSICMVYRLGNSRLVSASSASATTSWCGRPDVARLQRWCGLRRCSSAGNDPQLDTVFLAEASVHHGDARLVDSPGRHQIVSGASAEQIGLPDAAAASAVSDYVGCSSRVVLQFNPKIVETSFLIVKRATAANIKLPRRKFVVFRGSHVSCGRCGLTAGG